MKTIAKSKRSFEEKTFSRGGRGLHGRLASQIRWISTAQDLKDLPRSSWKGHIAERMGHLMLIFLIWIMPLLSDAEIFAKNPVMELTGEKMPIKVFQAQADLFKAVSKYDLNRYDREAEQLFGQFQIKDQVLLSWKTFFRDQSMLGRRIDVYA